MFLAAVAHPRFDREGKEIFSGKIEVFPFVIQEEAQRSSINRLAGTMETKLITSITRDIIRSFLIEKVIPSIKEKCPRDDSNMSIFIQQDNARTHIKIDDEEFRQAATQDGFDIRLMCQPPNSPDLNILNLGFFRAIQALQQQEATKTFDELIGAVLSSYESFTAEMSNRIFLTMQSCMIEIMQNKGSNKYDIPHIKKSLFTKAGQLPIHLSCECELVQEVLNYLG